MLFAVVACGPTNPVDPNLTPSPPDAASPEASAISFADSGAEAAAPVKDAGSCDPPDMLVILDRSDSMSTNVGTQGSRIDLAMSAIDTITAPPTDGTVRFGFQVLPQIGGAECSTELVVPIGLGNGTKISGALGAMSPQLDYGTPIGAALTSAEQTLAGTKTQGRDQYILLITDGGECCSCSTDAADLAQAQKLYQAGVKIFAVGFGGDDDPVLLDNLACAGHTAQNFATDCTCDNAGNCQLASTVNASTTQLYYKASDGAALKQAVASITNQVCCDCNVNPN